MTSSSPSESHNSIASFFVFFLNVPLDFEIDVLPLHFLTWFCSFVTISFILPPTIASSLLSTFGGIQDPITLIFYHNTIENCSNSYLQMRVLPIRIIIDSMSSKEYFGSVVGFRNHCHLVRNIPLRKYNYIKISIKKLFTTNTHTSQLQKFGVVNNWKRQPSVMPLTIYPIKVIIGEKY